MLASLMKISILTKFLVQLAFLLLAGCVRDNDAPALGSSLVPDPPIYIPQYDGMDNLTPIARQPERSSIGPTRPQFEPNFSYVSRIPSGPIVDPDHQTLLFESLPDLQKFQIGNASNLYYYSAFPQSYHPFTRHSQLAYRFEVLGLLGEGTYGHVFSAYDHKLQRKVAVKIFKLREDAVAEAKIMRALLNSGEQTGYIQMLDSLEFAHHSLIVMPQLSMDLHKFLKRPTVRRITAYEHFKTIAKQLIVGLSQIHDRSIIMNDLKPQNILLASIVPLRVYISDFSSSCIDSEFVEHPRVTLIYEAPEITFDRAHDRRSDIWSLGVTLAEIYRGSPLVPYNKVHPLVHITRILQTTAPMSLVRNSNGFELYQNYRRTIAVETNALPHGLDSNLPYDTGMTPVQWLHFVDLISKMLTWLPEDRISLADALKHPFFEFIEPQPPFHSTPQNDLSEARAMFDRAMKALKRRGSNP